ncbi:hypothetical protein Sme01_34420 [Sphaerisporangium melleum]|uniref:HTH tetR-type domain-containing protein n=1 Tax=Sphaerisporangium melleum TaxID=321316 RepID=A0A917QYA3_9ACTN|nr:TetR/AcrR family transcriptional regulator [Sphaerisporangium melleum]GGK74842.1 hypothetical protein GCM10007964_17100 [Sphaerisporangium melleum]GII70966.1 hypothetical protein Sme01_34420 [Sphaerisporangium melleum]
MKARTRGDGGARDRLLLAAAELLESSGDRTLSTRAVCERAGVQAPTLYHHFGSKQGLINAVINHGFTQYVQPPDPADASGDPVDGLRTGWDRHVRYGLEHPAFYALLYGRVEPGKPCAITAPAHAMLRDLLAAAARQGLLTVTVDDAAEQILAANVGVTLSLITQPGDTRDLGLSDRVREAALAGVLRLDGARSSPGPRITAAGAAVTGTAGAPTRANAALTLRALIEQEPAGLTPGEHALLGELLDRLAGSRLRPGPPAEPGRSGAEPGRSSAEAGGSYSAHGGSGAEPGGSDAEPGGSPQRRAGSADTGASQSIR